MEFLGRPDPSEYAVYYHGYVAAAPDGDLARSLREQASQIVQRLERVPAEREGYRYADGKWSVREVVGHMSDTERVFSYRLLAFARGDSAELPGMDQEVYIAGSRFDERPLASIAAEFAAVRAATLALVESLRPEDTDRVGVASGYPVSVRALAWIIAGHAQHHLDVLRDRYGV